MIKKISIHNYKSFHPTTLAAIDFDTGKQATFIYGLNGAGKSAIGEVVHGRSVQDDKFAHCQVETTGTGPFRHLVYNHAFAGRVIGETMQGIFTIGEVDTAKQKDIDEKDAENAALNIDVTMLRGRIEVAQKLVDDEISRGIDDIWKAHGTGKATKLASMLEGYGRNKKGFFNDLRTYEVVQGIKLDTIARLEQRYADVSGTEASKTVSPIDLSGLAEIEEDAIWADPVEVSAASRLAPLIAKLGNGDWVDQGRPYAWDEQCPFCQQRLPHDFEDELAKLLEGGRKLKIDKIAGLVSNYALRLEQLQERMSGVFDDPITKETGLELAWSKLEGQMKASLSLMRTKQAKPSNAIKIAVADHQPMRDALAALKAKVDDFNKRILDRSGERANIRKMFYGVLQADRVEAYAAHDAALAPLEAQLTAVKARNVELEQRIAANTLRLAELRGQQTGVDASVEAINARLQDMGITSFWITRKDGDGHLYCLARPHDVNCSAQSLSEGEKTLISFLYFIELIKGSHEEAGNVEVSKTIVVIDDPISSLSQNYIYDVATIIQHQLIKPLAGLPKVRQVIVLTHNLFFFHELIYQLAGGSLEKAAAKCQLLRVQKNDYSAVVALDPLALMNDYDALWQVLRDARDNKAPVQVVPNTMRCILEQFFTFTAGTADLANALKCLALADHSNKFTPLERYLNRGSHKDGINGPPIDWSQYDIDYYMGKLRALLKAVGHENHYLRKMGEEVPQVSVA
ncbi:AAA family ATPase [Rhodanobacter ginsengisoli]|uniref:AAA family ATPase n=1 Tax=Rhodanobacter ginsengisoli TaxID=418646 RepID=A0ABW0QIB7_9GAMM